MYKGISKEKFNKDWLARYPWINAVTKQPYKAYCRTCRRIFSIAQGEKVVTEHDKTHPQKDENASVENASNENASIENVSVENVSVENAPVKKSVKIFEELNVESSEEDANISSIKSLKVNENPRRRKSVYKEIYGSSSEGKISLNLIFLNCVQSYAILF